MLTPLEQFNEEVRGKIITHTKAGVDNVKAVWMMDFITKTLAAHKELILKMVREKAEDSNGYGEFLDDLKTF